MNDTLKNIITLVYKDKVDDYKVMSMLSKIVMIAAVRTLECQTFSDAYFGKI